MTCPTCAAMREALRECADDLQSEIDARYAGTQNKYPSEMRRYQRDIEPVTRARAALATPREGGSDGGADV